jgi:CrcB protein
MGVLVRAVAGRHDAVCLVNVMIQTMTMLWICLAGAAGTGTRHALTLWAAQRFGTGFPYGTLIVNLAGCFAIAAIIQAAATQAWSPTARTAMTVGFLGGFTTYSSFNHETMRLYEQGVGGAALLNVALTVAGGLMAGWAGATLARMLTGR